MVVTTAYAILFAGMKLLRFPTEAFLFFAGIITFVGIVQALLSSWGKPRKASIFGGIGFYLLTITWEHLRGNFHPYDVIGTFMFLTISGAIFGYFCGVLVAGVFLVTHYARKTLGIFEQQRKSADDDLTHTSPWDEED